MTSHFSIGLDFGTNSVRALIVDTHSGQEIAAAVFNYPTGRSGIILDPHDPNLARQNPQDYLDGTIATVREALATAAANHPNFSAQNVIGIGVDTTGSTPIPIDTAGTPLALTSAFKANPAAQVWLWKDHTGHAEAAEITAHAQKTRPHYLAKCGGTYSSEWFWSKLLHCARTAPDVFAAAHTWVEHSDWLPAILTGNDAPEKIKRGICAAGHKGLFHTDWGGYPDAEFLGQLHPELTRVRQTLPDKMYNVSHAAGALTPDWAAKLGLPAGIPVAVGAFDAHLGGVGSGIREGTLVKIIGTSTCDMLVAPLSAKLPDIPGVCGIVPESVLPGQYGIEAGQSAVGDIFNWFVEVVKPGNMDHVALTRDAEKLRPGQSGLLALDWLNGNRTILIDQRLTGLILGLTLQSTPAEIYRALVEATAFGARVIVERVEEYGVKIEQIVNCGGISAKNPMVMQIYADIMGRPLRISSSTQTCALGAAMCGAVVAGADAGGHADFTSAAAAMTHVSEISFDPNPTDQAVYNDLYKIYRKLHDAFGVHNHNCALYEIMKDLLRIRDKALTSQ